jgi:hypothetical protein
LKLLEERQFCLFYDLKHKLSYKLKPKQQFIFIGFCRDVFSSQTVLPISWNATCPLDGITISENYFQIYHQSTVTITMVWIWIL